MYGILNDMKRISGETFPDIVKKAKKVGGGVLMIYSDVPETRRSRLKGKNEKIEHPLIGILRV